jgi:biotin carboxyl carrier protein
MEHALLAPSAGKITGISARVGDSVEQGKVLMVVVAPE